MKKKTEAPFTDAVGYENGVRDVLVATRPDPHHKGETIRLHYNTHKSCYRVYGCIAGGGWSGHPIVGEYIDFVDAVAAFLNPKG